MERYDLFTNKGILLYYWDSLVRSYNRLLMVERGEWYEKDFGSELDLYYCFFVKCYHFKDWLMQLAEKDERKTINEFVKNSIELNTCKNICNSTKHFLLDRNETNTDAQLARFFGGEGISISREYLPFNLKDENMCYEICIQTVSRKWGAIELATRCMEQWVELVQHDWNITLPSFKK